MDKLLNEIIAKHKQLTEVLSSGELHHTEASKLSKEKSNLDDSVEKITQYNETKKQIVELKEILASDDDEMIEMAKEELADLESKLPMLEQSVKLSLIPKDESDNKNVILEIRAGTGGDEAALFGGVLLRMYQRFADKKRWKFEIMNISENGIGGVKECVISVQGDMVFRKMKYEAGVHRVQRVPETENAGRVHTSAVTVAILPEMDEFDVKIDEKDLKIDIYRASGPGGQGVNTTDSAVRITHIPTGVVVTQQDERSQIKNKEKAMKILRSRIYEAEEEKRIAERSSNRKMQVGTGDRGEKIRTYNYPQGRVTDHRINLTLYQIEKITNEGSLDEIIDALTTEDELKKLENMDIK